MSGSSERQYLPFELASRVFRLDSWSDPYRAYEELATREAIVRLLTDDWRFEGKQARARLRQRRRPHPPAPPGGAEKGDFWGADLDEASIDWLEREAVAAAARLAQRRAAAASASSTAAST